MTTETHRARRPRADSKYPLILEIVKILGSATKREIQEAASISGTGLARHLRKALKTGELVLDTPVRIPNMAGRPALRYMLPSTIPLLDGGE